MTADQNPDKTSSNNAPEKDTDALREEMSTVIADFKKKMQEIDRITLELEQKRTNIEKSNPKKTQHILEEIKVPSLEMLK